MQGSSAQPHRPGLEMLPTWRLRFGPGFTIAERRPGRWVAYDGRGRWAEGGSPGDAVADLQLVIGDENAAKYLDERPPAFRARMILAVAWLAFMVAGIFFSLRG